MRSLRVCLVITEDWYFWSHRRSLARYLTAHGHDVHLVTRLSKLKADIEAAGVTPHSVGLQRTAKNPFSEAVVTRRMAGLFHELKPDVVHLVGMKPILYGSIASRMAKVPATVCAIAGLGWLFTPGGILKTSARQLVSRYFRHALSNNPRVQYLVQNSHHRDVLLQNKMAGSDQVTIVSGAGVDPNRFRVQPEPDSLPTVMTHARMLWDKGIGDLVDAARIIKQQNVDCRIRLVGDPDPANPASIPMEQLNAWNAEEIVTWQGRSSEIPQLLADSHIACLPSYHEGFPLSLVEAMSCGRPVVTNDIPGCRDAVTHERSGLLVPKGDAPELAKAIVRLVQDPALRRRYGAHGRRDVMKRMCSEIVNQQTLDCYAQLLDQTQSETQTTPARRAA